MSGVTVLPTSAFAAAPVVLAPPTPPPAVNPPPYLQEVTTPGPTRVGQGSGYVESKDMVWGPQGSPYIVTGWLHVETGQSLTLLPGTVVKFEYVDYAPARNHITVHGRFNVLGTPDRPVIFTSSRDDTVMGDTNGDGSATSPAPGDWRQITVAGPTNINFAELRYGGESSTNLCGFGAPIYVLNEGRLVLANSRITHSPTAGVKISGNDKSYAGVFNTEIR